MPDGRVGQLQEGVVAGDRDRALLDAEKSPPIGTIANVRNAGTSDRYGASRKTAGRPGRGPGPP